ncbi:hypothetical protein F5B19DRAFT_490947 [Rostrohypoxylon terebratum]|nr:hypothetical protein F5B19DRAFT_490947 [Rostrohypoxylon terebratum]
MPPKIGGRRRGRRRRRDDTTTAHPPPPPPPPPPRDIPAPGTGSFSRIRSGRIERASITYTRRPSRVIRPDPSPGPDPSSGPDPPPGPDLPPGPDTGDDPPPKSPKSLPVKIPPPPPPGTTWHTSRAQPSGVRLRQVGTGGPAPAPRTVASGVSRLRLMGKRIRPVTVANPPTQRERPTQKEPLSSELGSSPPVIGPGRDEPTNTEFVTPIRPDRPAIPPTTTTADCPTSTPAKPDLSLPVGGSDTSKSESESPKDPNTSSSDPNTLLWEIDTSSLVAPSVGTSDPATKTPGSRPLTEAPVEVPQKTTTSAGEFIVNSYPRGTTPQILQRLPHGFTTIPNDVPNGECGLTAIVDSIAAQLGTTPGVRLPGFAELFAVWLDLRFAGTFDTYFSYITEPHARALRDDETMGPENFDLLAATVIEWGRRNNIRLELGRIGWDYRDDNDRLARTARYRSATLGGPVPIRPSDPIIWIYHTDSSGREPTQAEVDANRYITTPRSANVTPPGHWVGVRPHQAPESPSASESE